MNNDTKILVSIVCITYNHEAYIRQCLDGFMKQKTNFAFEVLIHDDASNDKTADIIREYEIKYPNIIRPIYQTENQYSKGISIGKTFLYPRAQGKYIAECEGDDYWTDPFKLQKQVDFLEANEDYGMIHTYFDYVDVHGNKIAPPTLFYQQIEERVFDGYIWDYYLCDSGFILTCTCCFRASLYRHQEKIYYDHGLFMTLARQAKVYCLKETTASYRRNPQGAMMTEGNYYNKRERLVKLDQLYWFYKSPSYTLGYYRINKVSINRIENAYAYLLLDILRGRLKIDKKFLWITRKKPMLLLKSPFRLLVIFKNRFW